jgi:hypothetical protein
MLGIDIKKKSNMYFPPNQVTSISTFLKIQGIIHCEIHF